MLGEAEKESQQENGARGQWELATMHHRVFGKYECVKYAVLHRKVSHGNKLSWVKNDEFWYWGRYSKKINISL